MICNQVKSCLNWAINSRTSEGQRRCRRSGLLPFCKLKDKRSVRSNKFCQEIEVISSKSFDVGPFDRRQEAIRMVKARANRTLDGYTNGPFISCF